MIIALTAVASARAADPDGLTMEVIAVNLTPDRYVWDDAVGADPVAIVISIGEQRAHVYRGDKLVAASTVSTGRDGKETPLGDFTILQKASAHRSNRYGNASMPFMQRLTWDGVAIHAGHNPGFPASHGCIRVPIEFARKLFAVTSLGTRVTVVAAGEPTAPTMPTYATPGEAAAHAAAERAAMATAAG